MRCILLFSETLRKVSKFREPIQLNEGEIIDHFNLTRIKEMIDNKNKYGSWADWADFTFSKSVTYIFF